MIPRGILFKPTTSSSNAASPTSTRPNSPSGASSPENKALTGNEVARNALKSRVSAFSNLGKSLKSAVPRFAGFAQSSKPSKASQTQQAIARGEKFQERQMAARSSEASTPGGRTSPSSSNAAILDTYGYMVSPRASIQAKTQLESLQARHKLMQAPKEHAQPYYQALTGTSSGDDSIESDRAHLTKNTSINSHLGNVAVVQFKGLTAEIPKSLQLNFMQLRTKMLHLPLKESQQYGAQLKEALASNNPESLTHLVSEMSKQVDRTLKGLK